MTKLEPTRTSSDPTATERLRRLLDERGVEWAEYGDGYTLLWHGGREYTVQPNVCNRLIVTNLTPEQAIAATLGPCSRSCNCTDGGRTNGTCHAEGFDDGVDEGMDGEWYSYSPPTWYLSCGHEVHDSERPRFCPVCGREVVDE